MALSWAQMPTQVQLALVGGVGERRLFALHGHEEIVRQVRVAAAVPGALEERQVRRVVDRAGEFSDRLGESAGEIGDGDAAGDFRFRQAAHVKAPVFRFRSAATRS
jgi:hypothetical protein